MKDACLDSTFHSSYMDDIEAKIPDVSCLIGIDISSDESGIIMCVDYSLKIYLRLVHNTALGYMDPRPLIHVMSNFFFIITPASHD